MSEDFIAGKDRHVESRIDSNGLARIIKSYFGCYGLSDFQGSGINGPNANPSPLIQFVLCNRGIRYVTSSSDAFLHSGGESFIGGNNSIGLLPTAIHLFHCVRARKTIPAVRMTMATSVHFGLSFNGLLFGLVVSHSRRCLSACRSVSFL